MGGMTLIPLPPGSASGSGWLDVAVGKQLDGQPVQPERAALIVDNRAVPATKVPPENGVIDEASDNRHAGAGERSSFDLQGYLL